MTQVPAASYTDVHTQLRALAIGSGRNGEEHVVTTPALARATRIVETASHTSLVAPRICATLTGGILLEWELSSIKLSIEVAPDGATAVSWPGIPTQ